MKRATRNTSTDPSKATILKSSQQLLAVNRPTDQEYRSVQNYITNNNPLHDTEQEYIRHKHDLITLRPGRDHAWLDRTIDRSLQILHKPFPFVNVRNIPLPSERRQRRKADIAPSLSSALPYVRTVSQMLLT